MLKSTHTKTLTLTLLLSTLLVGCGTGRELAPGDRTIDGNTYTEHTVKRNVQNDSTALDTLKSVPATITFQTCEAGVGSNGASLLTI